MPFKFSTVIPADIPLVMIDFGLIEQVLHNLLLNATQNVLVGSTIRLKQFYDNGLFIIQVMYRGKGFPTGELDSVFNKFYQGKDALAGGTGLGLSIVICVLLAKAKALQNNVLLLICCKNLIHSTTAKLTKHTAS